MLTICHVDLEKGFRGGERQASLLIEQLSLHQDIKQYLVCRQTSPLREYLKNIPNLSFISAKNPLRGHFDLKFKADILHSHDGKGAQWCAMHHLLYKTPYIITRRVPQAISKSRVNKYIYTHASYVVSISKYIGQSILDTIGKSVPTVKEKLHNIYSVLAKLKANPDNVKNIKAEYQGKLIIGNIGAYVDRHKGQKVLIEAGKIFLKNHPDTVFLFLGKGEDESEFKQLAGDDRFKFLGFKNNVVDYIEAFDIFAFPSRNEGLGSVLLDVMDHKIPIVASKVDGIPEIVIDNKTGLLFENANSEQLAEKLELLFQDNALKDLCIENAYKQLEQFTAENMANSYLKLYKSL